MSRYPVINAGTTPTTAVLQAMIPQRAVKSAATSRSSANTGTTLTADPDLSVPVEANATYDVELYLLYNGAATGSGDFKFSFSVPSGATLAGGASVINNPLGVGSDPVTGASTLVSFGNGTGNPLWCSVWLTLFTSATPGSLTLNWAQNTSSATSTTLMAGAKMSAARSK